MGGTNPKSIHMSNQQIFETYKQWFWDYPQQYLKQHVEVRAWLLLIGFTIATVFLTYVFLLNLRAYFEQRKKVYFIDLRFPVNINEKDNYLDPVTLFLNSCHSLLKRDRLSLEIHKVSDYIDLRLGVTNRETLTTIRRYITNIDKVAILETEADYLDQYRDKIYIKRLALTKDFVPINLTEPHIFSQIVDFLASLNSEQQEQGSVLFILSPVSDKTSRIYKLINFNNERKIKNPALETEIVQANQELKIKAKHKMYFTNIYTLGSKPDIASALAYSIKSVEGNNHFSIFSSTFSHNLLKKLKQRYIGFENLFTANFRILFGSYFNSQEIALLFHPSNISRGSFGSNKSTVLESSPEFYQTSNSSILVGQSFLKTGEKKEINLPNSNRRRHTYVLGATGSGKSTTLIRTALSVIKQNEQSLIFFDPNGMDLKNIIKRVPKAVLQERLVYLDITNSDYIPTINPFMRGFKATKTQKDALTEDILSIFEQGAKDGDLGNSIKKLLKFCINLGVNFPDYYHHILTKKYKLKPKEAQKLVYQRQLSIADIPYLLNKNYGFKSFFQNIFMGSRENFALSWLRQVNDFQINTAILDGIDNRLSNITTSSILPILEGSKFDIIQMIQDNKIICISNTEPTFGKKGRKLLPQLLTTEVWAWIQAQNNPEDKEKVVMIVDEVEEVQLPVLSTMLSQARKYGLSLFLANQYLSQLETWFTKAILGNVGNLFIFKMRNRDEVKYITPLFAGLIEETDITSLDKFKGYLTTLNESDSRSSTTMSFETIDYKSEYPELISEKELEELRINSLKTYGEKREIVENIRQKKLEDPFLYFFQDIANLKNSTVE